MSKKNVTTSSSTTANQYNPFGLSAYNNIVTDASKGLIGTINDPFSNMLFNTQLQMGTNANNAQNSALLSATNQNLQARGINSNSPFAVQQMLANQRSGLSRQSNMYNNLLLNAAQLRQASIGQGLSFSPLQTGATNNSRQEQYQTGLGTWLPQVASLALAPFTGGASLAGGFAGAGGLSSLLGGGGLGGFFGAGNGNPMPTGPGAGTSWGSFYGSGTPVQ